MTVSELFQAYSNKDFQTGPVKILPIPGAGPTEPQQAQVGPAMKRFLVKPINPVTWQQQEVEVIRRMISTGAEFQGFEGFYRDPATQNLYATFQYPHISLLDFVARGPFTDEKVRWIFNGILRALCQLESLGIHHPNLHPGTVCFGDADPSSLKVMNPFLSDSLYQEVASVYCNKFNTLFGRAAFNKRYLKENVYEMFLILLALITNTDFGQFASKPGDFNPPGILRALDIARSRCSPQIGELLMKYLLVPIDQIPTPLMLANAESVPIELNSYYGHSRANTTFYYPFEPFIATKKLFSSKPSGNNRVPHWSEIDVYKNDDDLQLSRMYGISHRKKNFVIDEGPQKPLRPYYITLKVSINEQSHRTCVYFWLKDVDTYGFDQNATINPIEPAVQSNFIKPADSVARVIQPPPAPIRQVVAAPQPLPVVNQQIIRSEPRVTYVTHAPRETTSTLRRSQEYRPILDGRFQVAGSNATTTYVQTPQAQRAVQTTYQPTIASAYTSSQGPAYFQQSLPQQGTGTTTYTRPL